MRRLLSTTPRASCLDRLIFDVKLSWKSCQTLFGILQQSTMALLEKYYVLRVRAVAGSEDELCLCLLYKSVALRIRIRMICD